MHWNYWIARPTMMLIHWSCVLLSWLHLYITGVQIYHKNDLRYHIYIHWISNCNIPSLSVSMVRATAKTNPLPKDKVCSQWNSPETRWRKFCIQLLIAEEKQLTLRYSWSSLCQRKGMKTGVLQVWLLYMITHIALRPLENRVSRKRRPRKQRPLKLRSMIHTNFIIIALTWCQSSGKLNSAGFLVLVNILRDLPFRDLENGDPQKICLTIHTILLITALTWHQSNRRLNSAEIFRFGQHFAGSSFLRSRKRSPSKTCLTIHTILVIFAFSWCQSSRKLNSAEIFRFVRHFAGSPFVEISKTETLKNRLDDSYNFHFNCLLPDASRAGSWTAQGVTFCGVSHADKHWKAESTSRQCSPNECKKLLVHRSAVKMCQICTSGIFSVLVAGGWYFPWETVITWIQNVWYAMMNVTFTFCHTTCVVTRGEMLYPDPNNQGGKFRQAKFIKFTAWSTTASETASHTSTAPI